MDPAKIAAHLSPGFSEALREVRKDLCLASDPWWVIGSAAMSLHGVAGIDIGDIDILMGPGDALRVLAAKGTKPVRDEGESRFRSDIYGAWTCGTFRVEVMAGFAVRTEDRWVTVQPSSRVAIDMRGGPIFIPSVSDLIAMCDLFARPKDRVRRNLLEALSFEG